MGVVILCVTSTMKFELAGSTITQQPSILPMIVRIMRMFTMVKCYIPSCDIVAHVYLVSQATPFNLCELERGSGEVAYVQRVVLRHDLVASNQMSFSDHVTLRNRRGVK